MLCGTVLSPSRQLTSWTRICSSNMFHVNPNRFCTGFKRESIRCRRSLVFLFENEINRCTAEQSLRSTQFTTGGRLKRIVDLKSEVRFWGLWHKCRIFAISCWISTHLQAETPPCFPETFSSVRNLQGSLTHFHSFLSVIKINKRH